MDRRSERPGDTAPLSGVRVLAAEQMQSLPFGTQLLASLGAEVVKVEDPKMGDSGRLSRPVVTDVDGREVGATYLRNNLGKRSITLNLRSDRGRQIFLDLVPSFDVVAENLKAGAAEKLGIGYDAVSAVHPSVVYLSVSGFGSSTQSPYHDWPAYATTVDAMSGIYEANRTGDEPPRPGIAGPLGDISTATFAALGTLAALRNRDRTGQSQYVEVAMFDAAVAMQDIIPFMWSMGERRPSGDRRRLVGIIEGFRAADGFFVVQVIREHQFERLCKVLGHEEWLTDPRFADRAGWGAHVDSVVRPAVERWAATRTKHEAARDLCAEGLAAAPSNTPADLLSDSHLKDRGMLEEVPRPDGGEPLVVVGNPVKLMGRPGKPRGRWPALGRDTDEVLTEELGVSPDELAALREEGTI